MTYTSLCEEGHAGSPWPTLTLAGLTLDRPRVMGILNVTPDSFSDGGKRFSTADAIAHGRRMAEAGADIIDIGGESTRPGATIVSAAEEQRRILPVIEALADAGLVVSVDTRNAATMRTALDAGARIVNDISGLTHDPAAPALVAGRDCPIILMHMRGTPATMASLAQYRDVVGEIRAELSARAEAALAAGIRRDRIVLDPGIGFAKHPRHSTEVLGRLRELTSLGYPLLVGVSRKSFIGRIGQQPDATRRLGGSLAAGLFAVSHGAAIVRVHDVEETVQALRIWCTLCQSGMVSHSQPA